ncbi:MAG: amidohydrolase family protein [Burkholderiaceae bacterium]|jgi:predicted TIM-barrel fold metal-dependent hydrolase/F0F1-type ATP synthase membrane subunit c/vacuolar-type H+-ATPase subunit K|nr:amidohydrolase family protein [Burkholderiaceae bacterium]
METPRSNELSQLPEAASAGEVTRRDFAKLFGVAPSMLFAAAAAGVGAGAAATPAPAAAAEQPRKSTPIPDDVFIIDAVAHAYNLSKPNLRNRYAEALAGLIYGVHATWNPPDLVLPPEIFTAGTPAEAVAATVFLESRTDMAVHHQLRLDSWFHDGLVSEERNREIAQRWPNRFISYIGVDPTQPQAQYLDDLKRLKERLPQAMGLKLYPHQIDPYRPWRADDPQIMKLFEEAQKLGLKVVAIHKALPNGNVPMAPYKVDDIDLAADAFPDLKFEIVHAGMAFLEETAWAVARYPNVFANLEVTSSLLWKAPGWFEEIIGFLMFWGGPKKILWSTGAVLAHPQPLLQRMWDLQFSDYTMNKYGLPQITAADKTQILGGSYAAMMGLDIGALRAKFAGDEFARARAAGLQAPWSNWKRIAGRG